MDLDRLDADLELVGDQLVLLTLDDAPQHGPLAVGQHRDSPRDLSVSGPALASLGVALEGLLHDGYGLAIAERLLDEVDRAFLQRGDRGAHVAVRGDEDD